MHREGIKTKEFEKIINQAMGIIQGVSEKCSKPLFVPLVERKYSSDNIKCDFT